MICEVCEQEISGDPGDFGTRCLRKRMGSPSTAGMVCFRLGYERLARQAVAPSKERDCIVRLASALRNMIGIADVDGAKFPWMGRMVRDAVEALSDATEIAPVSGYKCAFRACPGTAANSGDYCEQHSTLHTRAASLPDNNRTPREEK